jgi:site-specific recombinase XerD
VPEGWSPHWARHTHATALLLAGVPEHKARIFGELQLCFS